MSLKKTEKTLKPIETKKTDEVVYRKSILNLLRPLYKAVNERITKNLKALQKEYIFDDWSDDLERGFNSIQDLWVSLSRQIPEVSTAFARETLETNKTRADRTMKKSLGINVFIGNEELIPMTKATVRENINLISSIGEEYIRDVETLVYEGALAGKRSEEIGREIAKKTGQSSRKAALIARDQVAKFNAHLNEARYKKLGVTEYIWRTSKDERVAGNPNGLYPNAKPSHWDREGKRYKYANPPDGGNPGERVNCRCDAEPIIDLETLSNTSGVVLNV